MNRTRPTYVVGVAAAALLLAGSSARMWLSAKHDALVESERLAQSTADDIARVRSLRTREERAALEPEGDANLTRLVRSALIASRVGEGAFVSLGSEGTVSQPGRDGSAGFSSRRTSLKLKGLRLDELGRFLERWRETQPVHVVTSIELTRSGAGRQGQRADTLHQAEERFDAAVVLTTYVVARPGAARKGGSA
ncbi:MAG: hypothetical protein IT459_21955 [Planctomycetes bacterium]|jgi:hypothetical protein|nr:hypothetical protein [Planctomycetota bacterium]